MASSINTKNYTPNEPPYLSTSVMGRAVTDVVINKMNCYYLWTTPFPRINKCDFLFYYNKFQPELCSTLGDWDRKTS